jgi:hypothetical protein
VVGLLHLQIRIWACDHGDDMLGYCYKQETPEEI